MSFREVPHVLQRITERIEAWPVEDWAHGTGRALRRLKRRLARRKARVAVGAAFALVVTAVAGNALWSQTGAHPAPLWGRADPARLAIASHGTGAAADLPSTEMVAGIQDGLTAAGFYEGNASGELDGETRAAIGAFERSAELTPSGEPSVALLAALTEATGVGENPVSDPLGEEVAALTLDPEPRPATATPAKVPGSVAEIQRLLNVRGFGPLTIDGEMGKRTRQALNAFAARAGMGERDGLSPEVLKALAAGQ